MDTLTITAESLRLQHCVKAYDDYEHLTGVFFRSKYAFGTDGKILAIRLLTPSEPNFTVIKLPKPSKKPKEVTFNKLGKDILVSSDGATTAAVIDVQAPQVAMIFRDLVEGGGNRATITINAQLLLTLAKALGADTNQNCSVTLQFDPDNRRKGILVASKYSDTVGVLMPLVEDEQVDPSDILAPILAVL
jgi:hypothetical protein